MLCACDRFAELIYSDCFMEASLARFSRISPALKRRAAQIELLLMDVDGTSMRTTARVLPLRTLLVCVPAALPVAKVPHSCAGPRK